METLGGRVPESHSSWTAMKIVGYGKRRKDWVFTGKPKTKNGIGMI
jgi:hypothetical protein